MHLRPLERDRDVLWSLVDVEGKRHVHDPRHTGHVALAERIVLRIAREREPLLRGVRQVRNRASLDDASAGGPVVARDVIFETERRAVPHLPHALQIRFAVRSPRQIARGLRARTGAGEEEKDDASRTSGGEDR